MMSSSRREAEEIIRVMAASASEPGIESKEERGKKREGMKGMQSFHCLEMQQMDATSRALLIWERIC